MAPKPEKAKAPACPPKYGGKKKIMSKYPDALGGTPKIKAGFSDAVKDSMGKGGGKGGAGSGSGSGSGSSPDPRSPRGNLNEKGTGTEACNNPQSEESNCAKKKAARMKVCAIGGAVSLLFLLLFWWLFKNSIYRVFGWPTGGDRSGGSGGDGDDYGGYGGIGGRGGKGASGPGGRKKKGQVCWFNFPCQYDYEEDEWKKPNTLTY